MKRLFYFISLIFFISCQNSDKIQEIEILTYFTNARDFQIYSTTDENGFTNVLFKSPESNLLDNCQTRINKSLIDSIEKICKGKTADNFIFKSSKRIWYCGNWQSVKVTFENGKNLIFKYPFANNENKQFLPFQSLSTQIQHDSLSATRLNLGQFGKLSVKQEDLSNYTFKEDSIFNQKHFKKK